MENEVQLVDGVSVLHGDEDSAALADLGNQPGGGVVRQVARTACCVVRQCDGNPCSDLAAATKAQWI